MGLEYKNLFFEGRFFKALNLAIHLKISSSFPNILNFFNSPKAFGEFLFLVSKEMSDYPLRLSCYPLRLSCL